MKTWIFGPWFKQTHLIDSVKVLLCKDGHEAVPSYDVHRMPGFHVQQQRALERLRRSEGRSVLPDMSEKRNRINDPEVLNEISRTLHWLVDRAVDSVREKDLGPVQYEKWLQILVFIYSFLRAYWSWSKNQNEPAAEECYIYDKLRNDKNLHDKGDESRLDWPLGD